MRSLAGRVNALPVVVLLLIGVLAPSPPATGVTAYAVTDLGTLGGDRSWATSVNELGQVGGWSETADGHEHAFIWQDGVMYDLDPLYDGDSCAYDLNESWQVVGQRGNHPCLWDYGVAEDLLSSHGSAYAINASGQVVGEAYVVGEGYHAFLWEDGVAEDLGTVWSSSESYGRSINASGEVVGYDMYAGAFLWENGEMTDLADPGKVSAMAFSINDAGQIAGTAGFGTLDQHACLWDNGVPYDLGTLGGAKSVAAGINTQGQIVGWSYGAGTGIRAFLWEEGVMYNLNDLAACGPDWVLQDALAINDGREIVGFGYHDGQTRAFLLTPIPEPFAIGSVALLFVVALRRFGQS